uniref:G-protein coupled receptors family 1 profile domain-containing protein n=1 Tax=Amphimedon queenslandica TaxID=400682 RepID=A0A1X7UJ67_AMPQE
LSKLAKERMERNYTFTGDFSPQAVAGVLSIEMILALIANAAGEWIIGSTDEEKEGTCDFTGFLIIYCVYVMLMILSLISIDRFLFIVKPHLHKRFMSPRVALVLVIIVWIVTAVLFSSGFINGSGIVYQYVENLGGCYVYTTGPIASVIRYLFASLILSIIIITSIWTFCFTLGESVYASKKKRLFGIFGSMLLVYGICFAPAKVNAPDKLNISALVLFLLALILSPVVQSYFRPEINSVIVNIICRKIMKKRNRTTPSN